MDCFFTFVSATNLAFIVLTKNQINFITSLQRKPIRAENNLFVVEGVKMVEEVIQSALKIDSIYATSDWINANSSILFSFTFEPIIVSDKELQRISSLSNPNEVLAVCVMKQTDFSVQKCKNRLTLFLDNIQDPGNLGTIIRIADWFGVQNIVCTTDTVDVYNPKVIQATMGSFLRVNVLYKSLDTLLKEANLLEIPIYGAALNGENLYSTVNLDKGIIVLGNESKGISNEILKLCSTKISIPCFSTDSNSGPDSLNVAVAAGIICSEFNRRNIKMNE